MVVMIMVVIMVMMMRRRMVIEYCKKIGDAADHGYYGGG